MHTAPDKDTLVQNSNIINGFFPRKHDAAEARLALCFDRTYLQQGTALCETTLGHVLTGGPHVCPGFGTDESQILLKKKGESQGRVQVVSRGRAKAGEVEAYVVWDASRMRSHVMEVAAYPVSFKAPRHDAFEKLATSPAKQRGQYDTLHRLGAVLEAMTGVKWIIGDNHGAHGWAFQWVLGQMVPCCQELLEIVPWFKNLRFVDLPETAGPPLPFRVCFSNGSAVHALCGPAHTQKNYVSQLRSPLGTPHYGRCWMDAAGAVELGLLPSAFMGSDGMSDKEACLWFLGVIST